MKVSIITVTYNSSKYLEDCINSIIRQNYKNIEYIVVDGNSTDGTVDIIKKYSPYITKWISEEDLLFVDSTHTVKPGSEVNKIILEILPRLKRNVWVHFHDIYFPYDYKRNILNGDLFFG